jgi:hypothetical protein
MEDADESVAEENDDFRPEYDLASLPGGVRGKYANRFREGTHLVRLDPDVATAFQTRRLSTRHYGSLGLAVETLYLAAPPPGHKCPG